MDLPSLKIDIDRLNAELDDLARFSDTEPPSVTRVLFSANDLRARAYLRAAGCPARGLV